jgi:hypothetical protein
MATSYLHKQLCDIFHYYLSLKDYSTCGVQVFFDYKEQHPIQYGAMHIFVHKKIQIKYQLHY